ISVFGAFSIAMVAYLFSTGLTRSAFTNTALSRPGDVQILRNAIWRTSNTSLLLSIPIGMWGVFSENQFLVILAVGLHGLIMFDFTRTFQSAAGNAIKPFFVIALWSSFPIGAFGL